LARSGSGAIITPFLIGVLESLTHSGCTQL
jgi:hypothetical protein